MSKINVLVLGVGGNVSQGILKAIAKSNLNCKVIGACVNSDSIGLYFCDKAYISPYAHSKEFIPWLIELCNREKVDIVFTGVEENIIKIAANLEEFNRGTRAIFKCTPYEQLKIGQDKLDTSIWLKNNGCNYPKYSTSKDTEQIAQLIEKVGFPLIAKPRRGKGSNGIVKINNQQELEEVLKLDGYIIQEYIGNEDSEYTVGCYCDKSGRLLNPIIMRRELRYGTTFKAEIVENSIITAEVQKICENFKPVGPLNIQLRMDQNNRPVCFELNVRFSGTTPMRAHFGFNDVEAMIKEYVLEQVLPEHFEIRKGTAYRYMNEIYIDDVIQNKIKEEGSIENIKDFQVSIDMLGG
jgi:carbamoyl-phosphate synthase large subunit